MTRKPLNKGDILRNKTNEYEIYEVISFSGFSSLIYKGFEKPSDTSSYLKPVIIKEFFPKDLFFQGIITRETDGKTITGLDKYPEQIATFEKQATISNEMSWNSEDNSLSSYFLYTQVFRTNGTSYIIMDSSSGCTLKEYVHEQGLPSNKAELIEYIELTKRIIEAIEPIHKKNYLHLDIKPDNLYVTDLKQDEKFGSSTIRAIDFGSCLPMFETFDTNDFMLQLTESGSYSSPVLKDVNDECFISFMESPSNFDYSKLNEQFKRLSQADDVYSICVILNEMITGNKTYSAVDFDKIKYLNLAEIDFLKKIFEDEFINGTNMDSLEFFKNLLNEFIGVMKHTLITKHSLWSGVLEYYFRHKDSIIFKTEHESLLNPKYKVPKFNIMANFKDETIPALEVIKNFEEKHIYIIAGGGMGKSIIAAEKFLEYLSSGSKIPVYVDLNDINICEYKGTPEKKLQKLILNRIISTTIDDMLVKKFEDELKRPSINSSEYCLIFDNLHKVDANIYIEALNIMSNNYNNARIIILGRDFSMSEKLNEKFICIPLVGITDSEKEKYNIPFRKVFSVPLFSAIYLELHSIQESTLVNEGDLIWKYLSGVKGYGGNITITQEDADALYKVKNIILPKIAYEISSKHESINICNISKFLNNISIQQFDKLALKLLGLVELRDGEYSFKHDFFTDYFASFYIAQTINSYLKSASTTCLRNINNNWNFEANNYIYAIFTNEFNLPLDTVMELLYAKLNLDINAKGSI